MKKTQTNITSLASLFFEAGTLRKTARSHRQTLLTDDLSDNIASHSYRVTLIAWHLAMMEGADPYKTTIMALFHDLAETRGGDQNWVHKSYVKVYESNIIQDQLKDNPFKKDLSKLLNEYEERKTLEANLAKDADLLDQILLLKEYEWQGNKEASIWLKGKQQGKRLTSKSAKAINEEILKQRPSDWWKKSWTADRK